MVCHMNLTIDRFGEHHDVRVLYLSNFVLALLPYHLVERLGQIWLHTKPNTQLAVLAVSNTEIDTGR